MNGTKGNTSQTLNMARIKQVSKSLQAIVVELSDIFPERAALINQLMYALLTRHHVMITGVYGTGKTDLLRTLFGCITGAKMEGLSFNKFMTETSVIGVPDTKKMREQGVVEYRREGSILDANFLELDEFLDASTPLLRVLLGIIHERRFKRGQQDEAAKLHTAVASTNVDLDEARKRDPQLGAVIDRFLFHCDVTYLKKPESRRRMYTKYLAGENPTTTITLDDLTFISGVVVGSNQIDDPFFVEIYDTVIEAYSKSSGRVISDRRKCKLLEIVEANALLNGRYQVLVDDIIAIRWGICPGHDDDERTRFDAVANPIIEDAKTKLGQNIDQAQNMLLDEQEQQIPVIPTQCDDNTLVSTGKQLAKLKADVERVQSSTDSTRSRQKKILARIDELIKEIQTRIITN